MNSGSGSQHPVCVVGVVGEGMGQRGKEQLPLKACDSLQPPQDWEVEHGWVWSWEKPWNLLNIEFVVLGYKPGDSGEKNQAFPLFMGSQFSVVTDTQYINPR